MTLELPNGKGEFSEVLAKMIADDYSNGKIKANVLNNAEPMISDFINENQEREKDDFF